MNSTTLQKQSRGVVTHVVRYSPGATTGQYFAPDGFFPDGSVRPWREIRIERIKAGMARFRYVDTNEVGHCPARGLRYRTGA